MNIEPHLAICWIDRYCACSHTNYIYSIYILSTQLVVLFIFFIYFCLRRKKKKINRVTEIIDMQVVAPIKAKSRLRFRLNTSKFATNPEKSATSTLGLVDGNSTITVNTMGDTTDDSSGDQKKGIDLAPANTISAFNNYSSSWREVSGADSLLCVVFDVRFFLLQFFAPPFFLIWLLVFVLC